MSNYTKGWYREDIIRKQFEKEGHYVVRSAGSKGLWDLVAISSHFIVLIQSKLNSMPTVAEKKAMAEFVCPVNCIKQIWVFRKKGKREIHTWVVDKWVKREIKK